MNDWFDAELHVDRALDFFERGRWAEAEAELRKALALNPDQAEWHYNLGLTLEAAGRDSEAYLSFVQAADRLSDDGHSAIAAVLAAGLAASRLGRLEESETWLERALRLDPRSEVAHATTIDNLQRQGRYDDAVTAFYLAQQTIDESAICYSAVAEALVAQGVNDKAEWCLKEALRLSPNLPRVRAQLGRVFAATNRPHRALQMYLRELRDDPGNIEALLDYGDLLVETGRLPDAAEKFRRVLELQPAHSEAHMRLGEIAIAMQRWEEAHLEFELVLKLDPGYPDARVMLAETLLQRDRAEEARELLEAEMERFDQWRDDQGQKTETERTASADDIVDFGDVARLGRVLLQAGMPGEAARVLQAGLDLGNDSPELLRHLAVAYFQSGLSGKGTSASRRVLRQEPECVECMHNLALAALEDGRLRIASAWIRRGLQVNRNDEGLRRLRIRLWWRAAVAQCRVWLGR